MSQQQAVPDAVQVALPTAYVGALVYGLSLQDWVWILTIVLLLLQIPYFIWTKFIGPWRHRRKVREGDRARRHTRRVVGKLDAQREAASADEQSE